MRFTWRQCGLLLLLAVLMFGPCARAQVTVGDNLHLNLSGDGFFGYNGVFPNVPAAENFSTNQSNFAGSAGLTGYYYHPNFVSFQVRPYYNQTRMNSNLNSIYGGKGLSASANLFSGSSTPGTIDFEKNYNSEEQLSVPGSPGFATSGDSTAFNIGWGFLFKRLPSIHVNYGIAKNSADILGTEARSSGHSRNFGIGAGYSLLGFTLSATYTNVLSAQQVPDLTDFNESRENTTRQNNVIFTASRRLSSWADFATSFNRTHFSTDFFKNAPTEQTYNTVNTNLSMRPLPKLDVNVGMNYTTNLSAIFLESVLPTSAGSASAAPPTTIIPITIGSSSEIYNVRANYRLTKDLNVSGGAQRLNQHSGNIDANGNSISVGVGYGHAFLGGQLGAYYGFGRYSSNTSQQLATGGRVEDNSSTTQTGGVSYSHSFQFAGWLGDGRVQYSRSMQTVLLGQVSRSLGGSASLSRKLGSWALTLNGSAAQLSTDGMSNVDSLATNFGASLSMRRFGFGGSYSRSNGSSLQTASGLVPSAVSTAILFPDLLALYQSESYGFSGSYRPSRRLQISGNYLHSLVSTNNRAVLTNSLFLRYDIKIVYTFRQLHFNAGYRHLSQGIGATFKIPAEVDAVYFGVSRHFDVF